MVSPCVFDAPGVKGSRKPKVERAPTPNESEYAQAPDETEPARRLGHGRENRQHKQQAKNTTGLKPAWNGDLRAQSVATQGRRALQIDALGEGRIDWLVAS